MSIRINLLASRRLDIQRQKNQRRYITIGSFGALILFAIFLVGITTYAVILRTTHKNLETKVSATEKRIKALHDVEMQYVYLKDKVGSLVKILEQTKKQQAIARYILKLFPQEIPLGGFSIGKNWVVNLGGETTSFKLLQTTLENLISTPQSEDKLIRLSGITLNSLSRNQDRVYQFKLSLKFK